MKMRNIYLFGKIMLRFDQKILKKTFGLLVTEHAA